LTGVHGSKSARSDPPQGRPPAAAPPRPPRWRTWLLIAGLAAERLVFGQTSTGAADDLVREYGMSTALGPVGFRSGSPMYLGGEEVRSRPHAEATQRVIDEEVATLLRAGPTSGPPPSAASTARPWTASSSCSWNANHRRHRRR
jgi:hypothetical protein